MPSSHPDAAGALRGRGAVTCCHGARPRNALLWQRQVSQGGGEELDGREAELRAAFQPQNVAFPRAVEREQGEKQTPRGFQKRRPTGPLFRPDDCTNHPAGVRQRTLACREGEARRGQPVPPADRQLMNEPGWGDSSLQLGPRDSLTAQGSLSLCLLLPPRHLWQFTRGKSYQGK